MRVTGHWPAQCAPLRLLCGGKGRGAQEGAGGARSFVTRSTLAIPLVRGSAASRGWLQGVESSAQTLVSFLAAVILSAWASVNPRSQLPGSMLTTMSTVCWLPPVLQALFSLVPCGLSAAEGGTAGSGYRHWRRDVHSDFSLSDFSTDDP